MKRALLSLLLFASLTLPASAQYYPPSGGGGGGSGASVPGNYTQTGTVTLPAGSSATFLGANGETVTMPAITGSGGQIVMIGGSSSGSTPVTLNTAGGNDYFYTLASSSSATSITMQPSLYGQYEYYIFVSVVAVAGALNLWVPFGHHYSAPQTAETISATTITGNTTLTAGSTPYQICTFSANGTVTLPTPAINLVFTIINNSGNGSTATVSGAVQNANAAIADGGRATYKAIVSGGALKWFRVSG